MPNKIEQNFNNEAFCKIPPIHVMPGVFLSAAAQNINLKNKKQLKEIEEKKNIAPEKKPEGVVSKQKERLIHPAILILGVFLLVGLVAVIFYLIFSDKKIAQPTPVVEQPVVIAPPVNQTQTKPPVKPPVVIEPVNLFDYKTTIDSDSDGLTDKEEQLYGTGINNSDEDQDKYVDGLEVISLYSPKGKDDVRLINSDMVYIFNNKEQGYSILHPRGWTVQPLKNDKSDVSFASDTGEFVEVLVSKNEQKENILAWAKHQYPSVSTDSLDKIPVGDALGIKSPNGLTISFADDNNIYSITYHVGTLRELNFKTTFQMMYNSLKLYSRAGEAAVVAEEWETYKNKTLGIQIQHPSSATPVAKDSLVSIDGFILYFIDNTERIEIKSWFEKNYFNKDMNKGCYFKVSDFSIGKMQTFLIDKDSESSEACEDIGYYAISSDNSRIVKLSLGTNPAKETAQILSTLVLLEKEISSVVPEALEPTPAP